MIENRETRMPEGVELPAPPQTSAERRGDRPRSGLAEFAESLLVTILLALFVTTFIIQAFKIPTQSMEPTLLVGDHLLVNKFLFEGRGAWYDKWLPYREIRRGDVIVFKFPYDDHAHYVKRVIGLPGERVKIVDQQVFINGMPLHEPYVVHNAVADTSFGDNFPPTANYFFSQEIHPEWAEQILNHVENGELIIPPKHYFVMGDNRDSSWDSRFWGFVDRDAIMGRPVVVYWSVKATSDDYANRSFWDAVVAFAQTLVHLPSRTRWSRLLRMVH